MQKNTGHFGWDIIFHLSSKSIEFDGKFSHTGKKIFSLRE